MEIVRFLLEHYALVCCDEAAYEHTFITPWILTGFIRLIVNILNIQGELYDVFQS